MGGSGGGGGSGPISYSDYLETRHREYIDVVTSYINSNITSSPFSSYSAYDIDTIFLGAGVAISSFSALFDIYETYIIDPDIDTIYSNIFEDTVNSSEVHDLVVAHGVELSDDIETVALPRLLIGARDINAVNNNSFVIAKGMLEVNRQKQLSSYSAKLKYTLIQFVQERFRTYLQWNQSKVNMYAELIKLYLSAKMDITAQNYEILAKDSLWPFTLFEYRRAAIGAMGGGFPNSSTGEVSNTTKAIGGALSGAASGAMVGSAVPGIGTAVGAIVGGVIGLAGGLLS